MIRMFSRAGLSVLTLIVAVCVAAPLPMVAAQDTPAAKQAPPKKPAKKKKERSKKTVGPAIGGNKATPIDRIKVADGFQAELLYSVPGVEQGSWVNLCTDDKGRILVSDQFGGLYRITPPAAGQTVDPATVEKVPADIRAVNGMVWAFNALYVGVNDYEELIPSGLYRITDSDGDDQLDHVVMLREVHSRGDHGVHALMPTPDGEALYLVTGNNTRPADMEKSSPVRQVWGEDHLLPSMPDGRGHNRGVLAPGGIIYRVSPDGKEFKAVASGFRNVFDAAVDQDGELFTYDADMEYDFNTPWYRPTRICHVVSGAEFGWRNGAGKRMPFFADNMPPVLDIGPGSPTGMTFGYGAKFPAKYQNALFALDWSWGKLYAVHLEPDGATYKATREEFVTGAPLPITDAIIHPQDGATVSQLRDEAAKLMARIGHCQRFRAVRHLVPGQHGQPLRRIQTLHINSQFRRQSLIQTDHLRSADGCRIGPLIKRVRQLAVGVVKLEGHVGRWRDGECFCQTRQAGLG